MICIYLPDWVLIPHLVIALPTSSTGFIQVYLLPLVFAQNFSAEKYA